MMIIDFEEDVEYWERKAAEQPGKSQKHIRKTTNDGTKVVGQHNNKEGLAMAQSIFIINRGRIPSIGEARDYHDLLTNGHSKPITDAYTESVTSYFQVDFGKKSVFKILNVLKGRVQSGEINSTGTTISDLNSSHVYITNNYDSLLAARLNNPSGSFSTNYVSDVSSSQVYLAMSLDGKVSSSSSMSSSLDAMLSGSSISPNSSIASISGSFISGSYSPGASKSMKKDKLD